MTENKTEWECQVGRCPSVGRTFESERKMEQHYIIWHPNLAGELARESRKRKE